MKITFYGAVKTVTGSQHLIEVNGTKMLLDCGLYQGRKEDMRRRNRHLPYDATSIDVMVLSHAHIDHSGNIPNLVKSGFDGDIYCTHATRDLCTSMLLDSGHIQERDAEYANRRRKKDEPVVEPIYTQRDAQHALDSFVSVGYNKSHRIAPGVQLTLRDAGHMLGSAMVVLDIDEGGKQQRFVFSGDIGREGIPIIRDPSTIDSADILLMESTYGGRTHDAYPDAEKELKDIVLKTFDRRGAIIMPAFAVGRTQQLVVQLNELAERGEIPPFPVYVDSPLAVDVTSAFRQHPECYDDEINAFMESHDDDDPFGFRGLHYIRNVEESKALNNRTDPMIIISASGMMEHGRIVHHLRNRIEYSRNTILVTGWQAPHTLGRRLVDGEKRVRIWGEEYEVNAQVNVLNGFSGHADHDELREWYGKIEQPPARTFLVHGEEEAAQKLAADLPGQVDIPDLNQSFEV